MLYAQSFYVPGAPAGQVRFAQAWVKGKDGTMKRVAFPPKDKDGSPHPSMRWREAVRVYADMNRSEHWPILKPWPVRISLEFRKIKPKGVPRWQQWWTTKPDRDNLDKAVLDALTGVVFEDDSQVVGGEITKIYHDQPGVVVTVQWEDHTVGSRATPKRTAVVRRNG